MSFLTPIFLHCGNWSSLLILPLVDETSIAQNSILRSNISPLTCFRDEAVGALFGSILGTMGSGGGDVIESIEDGVAVEEEADEVFGVAKVEVGIGGVIERSVGSEPTEIRTPGNSTGSLYAEVELRNGIRGVNDYIRVIDADGNWDMMNNRTGIGGIPRTFLISPGGEMSIHVVTKFLFMNSKFSITVKYYRASCKIILDSEMFDGNIVYLPGPTLEPLPANFSCTYEIPAPADGLYARVTIIRGLDKPNDTITVIDITGEEIIINSTDVSDSNHPYWYVLPGSVLTMKVTTAIDSMNSSLLISVEYLKANIGPTRIMRADSEINFVDMSTLRNERYDFCSITFLSDERIVLNHAFKGDTVRENPDRFVIDGTFSEQIKVYRLDTLDHWSLFQTKSKAITIVTFIDGFEGFVLNRKSESDKFYFMDAIATDPIYLYPFGMRASTPDAVMATEVVHFEARGILVQNLKIHSVG
ncbi:hypothetical protein GCK72_021515 [Caenorhabditis remanei]|uniref:CUB-like domain-containing protein n=1 Tax=Caenorhabditis remanei TaxID=31234 RepID=A0A6A5GID3_CAERE|nr:hypothetical protein GCK72_021515 [Caenorhabditis remanei]KAF1754950.1 hypothetical protein GCK72_021515 [Caenorhabditis remanei]